MVKFLVRIHLVTGNAAGRRMRELGPAPMSRLRLMMLGRRELVLVRERMLVVMMTGHWHGGHRRVIETRVGAASAAAPTAVAVGCAITVAAGRGQCSG